MSANLLGQILGWLRAGYPEGVPPKDYSPLLALLRRTLTEAEFDDVVAALELAEPDRVRTSHIREAIASVTDVEPNEDEVRQVAARLAAAGWPLSDSARRLVDPPAEPDSGLLSQVLRWLRAGYPEGIPSADQVPLLALLTRRLSDDEVRTVAELLAAQAGNAREVASVDAQVLMTKALGELPSDDDVDRVRQHLGELGRTLV